VSSDATAWAWKQRVPSSAKFVLVAMADQVTTDIAFMSSRWLCDATGQDRKTVLANLGRLVQWGLIEDTGERRGRTGQIPVYRLRMDAGLFDNAPFVKSTKSGTGTKNGTVPDLDGNSTVFPAKQSQKRDTDLKLTTNDLTYTPRATSAPPPVEPDAGALATRAMIEAGMPPSYVNPSHSELLDALAAGVTAKQLADVAREVISRGTGPPAMTYVIRTALGRHRTAARQRETADVKPATDQPGRRERRAQSANGRMLAAIKRQREKRAAAAAGTDTEPAAVG
jgi:pyocin large subunit-like protein